MADLQRCQRTLSLDELTTLVTAHSLRRDDLQGFLTTGASDYAHREVFRSPYLELGCIGWRPGQYTPVHDHHESVCCVLVLDGALTNTDYRPLAGRKVARHATRRLLGGEILACAQGSIHCMGNDSAADLFTMHLYSPPLLPLHARVRVEVRAPTLLQGSAGR